MDMFRVPFIISPQSYAFSAAGVLLASIVSVFAVAQLLGRLDMIAALKTIE
jgi:putative ABC transport system permease protein